eukprot:TRINITY_DN5158_c0_g1_i1.p1 TRINITY_DN5158_c0_g1~~TRINITY_DN5158_c0_g1_i1.p1  ORF type:complete len:645 (-),score=182.82 TRINITY_DN5158_c0_g1_i1:46-1980(-)
MNGYIENCYEIYEEKEKENSPIQDKSIKKNVPRLKKQKTFIMQDYVKFDSFVGKENINNIESDGNNNRNWHAVWLKFLEANKDNENHHYNYYLKGVWYFIKLLKEELKKTVIETMKQVIQDIFKNEKGEEKIKQIKGGTAGIKLIKDNLFFKLAQDSHDIYGGDVFAGKAANHELKSLNELGKLIVGQKILKEGKTVNKKPLIEGVNIPLFVLVDFLGFRVVASSVLPLNSSTIKYGSNDGGKTIHDGIGDKEIREKVSKIANTLYLKEHFVGWHSGKKKLHFSGDVEVHRGLDERIYIIDCARFYPPFPPDKNVKGCVFYQLFRPQFLETYKKPVSSDVFTYWGKHNAKTHNQEVRSMYAYYFCTYLPLISTELSQSKSHYTCEYHTYFLHSKGINCKDFGNVRSYVTDEKRKKTLLIDCTARSIRFLIRSSLSDLFKKGSLDKVNFDKFVENFFVDSFFSEKNGPKFLERWISVYNILLIKFKKVLNEKETEICLTKGFHTLFDDDDMVLLFTRVCNLCQISFHKSDQKKEDSENFSFSHFELSVDDSPLDFSDIKSLNKNEIVCKIQPNVKFLDFLNPIDEDNNVESPVLKRTETIGRLTNYSKEQFVKGFNFMLNAWGNDEGMKRKLDDLFVNNNFIDFL